GLQVFLQAVPRVMLRPWRNLTRTSSARAARKRSSSATSHGKEERVKRRLVQFGVAATVCSVAVLLGARLAVATIPDTNGTVHGCMKKTNGQVYVIDPGAGQTCGKDMSVDWNKTGATGPQGVDGPKGYTGFRGTTGSSGYEQTYDQETTDSSGNGSAEADC